MANYGYLTSDEVIALQTILNQGVDRYNQEDRNWKALFCNDTTDMYVRVMQRSQSMEEVGEDTSLPAVQTTAYQTITLPAPKRYALRNGVTRAAIDQGVTEEQVRTDYEEAYLADGRLLIKYCTRAMLLDGGWWDATATPPTWAENSFTSSHDHYVAVNQGGVPNLANFVTAKRHIQEHGFGLGNSIACFMHGDTVGTIEKIPEFSTAPGPMPTTYLDALQRNGLVPGGNISNVAVFPTDWVPKNYAIFVDMARKPLHWRNPRGAAANGALQVYRPDTSDMDWAGKQSIVRWASAKVTLRGAGLAMYFSGSSWTDPTISLTA